MKPLLLPALLALALLAGGCSSKAPEPAPAPAAEAPKAEELLPPQEERKTLMEALYDYYDERGDLLARGIDPRVRGDETLLVREKRTEAKEILTGGADANAADDAGYTPLILSVYHNDPMMIKLLVRYGADVNLATENGPTPLVTALVEASQEQGYDTVIEYLLKKGANPDAGQIHGDVPLMFTVKQGMFSAAELLAANHASLNIADASGFTPLTWAVLLGDEATAKMLVHYGADVNKADTRGFTPYGWATLLGSKELAEAMEDAGGKIDKDAKGLLIARALQKFDGDQLAALTEKGPGALKPKEMEIKVGGPGFVSFTREGSVLRIRTTDPLIKRFVMDDPDRLVLDFKRLASFPGVSTTVATPFVERIAVGNHFGSYRVVLYLKGKKKYEVRPVEGGFEVEFKE